MFQKVIAGTVVGFFVFVLLMSAWDYCRPDPDALLFKEQVSSADRQIKKEHHPCASLRDAYVVSSQAVINVVLTKHISSTLSNRRTSSVSKDSSFGLSGLSPPLENSPPLSVPLFQLHSNLRI